jgi:hypothetical protein
MHAVDEFVIYDDVNFIKRGWVHRNKTVIGGQESYIGLTLSRASQNKKINEIALSPERKWRDTLLKKITHRYCKSKNFGVIFPMVEKWLNEDYELMADFLHDSLVDIRNYLEIDTKIVLSSACTSNQNLRASDRILDTCIELGANAYINAINGQSLYDKAVFEKAGVDLFFISNVTHNYSSILDLMMDLDKSDIQQMLNHFTLL